MKSNVCACSKLMTFAYNVHLTASSRSAQSITSLCAHNTCKYAVAYIWWAQEAVTVSEGIIEMRGILICNTSCNCLRTEVEAGVCWSIVSFTFSHKPAIVLSGPWSWTPGFSRNHDRSSSVGDITDSTRWILLSQICKRASVVFMLWTLHYTVVRHCNSICFQMVVGIIRQTNLIRWSSPSVVISSTCSSSVNQLSSSGTWTGTLPPSCVCHSGSSSLSSYIKLLTIY